MFLGWGFGGRSLCPIHLLRKLSVVASLHLAGSPEDAGPGAQEVQLLPGAGGRGGGLSGGGAGLGL